jgi:hypothetical protein
VSVVFQPPVVPARLSASPELPAGSRPRDGGEGLADGELHRAERGAVHPLAREHLAARIDDRRGEREVVRLGFLPHAREQREREFERQMPA